MKNLLVRAKCTRRPGLGKGLASVWGLGCLLALSPSSAVARELVPGPFETVEHHRASSLVPLVRGQTLETGGWEVGPVVLVDWGIAGGAELAGLAERLDTMQRPLGRTWRPFRVPEVATLTFEPGSEPVEGYTIRCSPSGVTVRASGPEGRYYGLVTLTQMLPPVARGTDAVRAAAGLVSDSPAYSWRGLMLDSSRHYQSPETLKWVLELMALHKLNRFHWHLTDDQGWRLPVAAWPRLASVGAWRTEADGSLYGRTYTPEEIRSLVAYAARRHIVVVPEIDLPGHSSAALAAYPELSASGMPRQVPLDWGVADGVLSLGRPSVTRFTSDVLAATVDLFPGPWIHWGGDEVYRTPWMKNAESQAWMRASRLSTAEQALGAFWSDLARRTQAAGRVPIGWDDVTLHNPPAGTLLQWWDDPDRAQAALRAGYSLIASWKETTYLDYPELDSDGDRASWMPVQTLESVARQPFWPPGTPDRYRAQILGVEAGLWTERATEPKLGRKLFPRLSLVADLAWTGQVGGAPGWARRIAYHRDRLTAWGVGMPPSAR